VATADGPAAAPGDPYATSKANLRDTIKWLAGIFGALAAAVVVGAPVSGLGALQGTREFWIAGAALVLGFGFICAALIIALRLLRSDLLYASDLDPGVAVGTREGPREIQRIRDDIDRHATDLFPVGYLTMKSFLAQIAKSVAQAKETADEVAALSSADAPDDDAIAAAVARYGEQQAVVRDYRASQQRVMAYASYLRFYNRLSRATKWLLLLGIGALLSLAVFGIEVQGPKDVKPPTVVVIPLSQSVAPPAGNTPARFGELDPVYFATGSSAITAEGRSAIERARNALRDRKSTALLLMARTDTVGTPRVNTSLAHDRGMAVRRLLVEKGGLAPSQVFVAELPKSDLPELTAENQASLLNRTVTLHVVDFDRPAPVAKAASAPAGPGER